VSGYTTIDYFEETNTVDAYSETDEDYDVNSAYSPFVSLTVRDQNNNYMGGAIATDDGTYGFAAVEVQFSGSPDATYTALALHKAYANEWEYDMKMPHYSEVESSSDWHGCGGNRFFRPASQDMNWGYKSHHCLCR
jgi:hypothetical protein